MCTASSVVCGSGRIASCTFRAAPARHRCSLSPPGQSVEARYTAAARAMGLHEDEARV